MNSLEILRNINSNIKERIFHEHTYILYDLRTKLGNSLKTYLEIGSYIGSSASLILSHEYPTKVFCVDPCNLNPSHYNGNKNQYETLLSNLNETGNSNFTIIKDYSYNVDLDTDIDLLFIDGDHSYQSVINDFNKFSKHVSYGGYIVFDDYLDSQYSPEVKKAVDDVVYKLDKDQYEIIGTLSNTYKALPHFTHLNEFIIFKKPLFAIIIPTYQRKNGKTKEYIQKISEMLLKQTYQNYTVFLIGDDYTDKNEFLELVSLFDKEIYHFNNEKAYREGYFNINDNKWCIGGVMAIEHGVRKAKEQKFRYYLHLDDDDYWEPNKLQVVKESIEEFPESDFIFHCSKLHHPRF